MVNIFFDGIISNAFKHIFGYIHSEIYSKATLVYLFVDIYNEEVINLLQGHNA